MSGEEELEENDLDNDRETTAPVRKKRGRGRGRRRRRGRGRRRKRRKKKTTAETRDDESIGEVSRIPNIDNGDDFNGEEEEDLSSYGEDRVEESNDENNNLEQEEVGDGIEYDEDYEDDLPPARAGLTWGNLDPRDIIQQDQVELEDYEDDVEGILDGYVGSNRRNGVYIEGGNKFKFKANLEDFLVKQNYKGSGKEDGVGEEGEGEIEDQTELLELPYKKFRKRLTNLILALFGFMKGVLAGMWILFLFIIYEPTSFSKSNFLDDYKPLASTFSKIFILMTTICFVCSMFMISVRCWSKESSKFQLLNVMFEGVSYFLIVICTFLCGVSDDYFSSHDVKVSSKALDFYFYFWHIFNGIRTVIAIGTYLLGTICSL